MKTSVSCVSSLDFHRSSAVVVGDRSAGLLCALIEECLLFSHLSKSYCHRVCSRGSNMVVKVYISGISGNKEVKKRQQRVLMILDSKNIKYDVIDITEPGREADKDFMQANSKSLGGTVSDPEPRHPLPPQIFNDDEYCGDYDQFDLANEMDTLEQFVKVEPPAEPVADKVDEKDKPVNGDADLTEKLENGKDGESEMNGEDKSTEKEGNDGKEKHEETGKVEKEEDIGNIVQEKGKDIKNGEKINENEPETSGKEEEMAKSEENENEKSDSGEKGSENYTKNKSEDKENGNESQKGDNNGDRSIKDNENQEGDGSEKDANLEVGKSDKDTTTTGATPDKTSQKEEIPEEGSLVKDGTTEKDGSPDKKGASREGTPVGELQTNEKVTKNAEVPSKEKSQEREEESIAEDSEKEGSVDKEINTEEDKSREQSVTKEAESSAKSAEESGESSPEPSVEEKNKAAEGSAESEALMDSERTTAEQ